MDTFLDNAHKIFEVARADSGTESSDFALLVREDGSLHFLMESELNTDAAAIETGARTVYRVSKSESGVRVSGREGASRCELSWGGKKMGAGFSRGELLRDQPLYLMEGLTALTSRWDTLCLPSQP